MGLHAMDIDGWQDMQNVKDWWSECIHKKGSPVKAMASLAMLISWEIWNERNARVFRQYFSTSDMVINRIKDEAWLWCLAGAKALCNIMLRE
jgi:predicted negative regulator of RcsB-dependent stress response